MTTRTRLYMPSRRSGMALPMVLWTIALLTGISLLLAGVIGGWITEETRAGKIFRARQQALSGIAIAMNPTIMPGDPLLELKGDEGYKVVIKDESGLINPNLWLSANPDRRDLFKRLFTAWGLGINEADAAADGLYDWQSQSPFRSLRGAKKPEYEAIGKSGLPPGSPFLSPDEMQMVIGFGTVQKARPDWRSYFTTYYAGKINILHAPKRILIDLLHLSPDQADQWIALRSGKDGIEGTEDDLQPTDIANAIKLIGARGLQSQVIGDTCGTAGSVRRIESTGFSNGVHHLITVIVAGDSTLNPQTVPTVLGWSEQ